MADNVLDKFSQDNLIVDFVGLGAHNCRANHHRSRTRQSRCNRQVSDDQNVEAFRLNFLLLVLQGRSLARPEISLIVVLEIGLGIVVGREVAVREFGAG